MQIHQEVEIGFPLKKQLYKQLLLVLFCTKVPLALCMLYGMSIEEPKT